MQATKGNNLAAICIAMYVREDRAMKKAVVKVVVVAAVAVMVMV